MKLYRTFEKLSYLFRYEATYLEMKYYLKRVMKGKRDIYLKYITKLDRCTGKSVALARLSAKYNIPIIVPTCYWKEHIEQTIPTNLPKYFKYKRPTAIPEKTLLPDMRFDAILIEECLSGNIVELANKHSNGKVVGFINIY